MSKVVVINNLTLDGVMQAPGRPDQDTRGGLEHVVIATYQSAGRRRRRVPRAEAGLVSVRSRRRRAR